MRKNTLALHRLAAWAGILTPLLFVMVFTIEGSLRAGYEPRRDFVSALSLGPRGWVQMTEFKTRRKSAPFRASEKAGLSFWLYPN